MLFAVDYINNINKVFDWIYLKLTSSDCGSHDHVVYIN